MLFHLTRFGTTWHVVVGEGFGFDISYEVQSDENECVLCFFKCQSNFTILCHLY